MGDEDEDDLMMDDEDGELDSSLLRPSFASSHRPSDDSEHLLQGVVEESSLYGRAASKARWNLRGTAVANGQGKKEEERSTTRKGERDTSSCLLSSTFPIRSGDSLEELFIVC